MTKARRHIYLSQLSRGTHRGLWAHLLLILAVTLFSGKLIAQEDHSRVIKSHKMKNASGGDIYVVIQRVENVMGTPYQVELRGSCEKNTYESAEKAPLLNVQNYCDVKLSSPKLEADSLSFTYRAVDAERFNRMTRKIEDPEKLIKLRPVCLKASESDSWNLKTFCVKPSEEAMDH